MTLLTLVSLSLWMNVIKEYDTMMTTDKKEGLKKPGIPVDPMIKRQVAQAYRHGKFGSQRGYTSVDVGYIGGISADTLATINPNSISTIGNGAWCWNHTSDSWFEKYVPKPKPNETTSEWVDRINARHWFDEDHEGVPYDVIIEAACDKINKFWQRYDSCDDG